MKVGVRQIVVSFFFAGRTGGIPVVIQRFGVDPVGCAGCLRLLLQFLPVAALETAPASTVYDRASGSGCIAGFRLFHQIIYAFWGGFYYFLNGGSPFGLTKALSKSIPTAVGGSLSIYTTSQKNTTSFVRNKRG